jgi:1-deoxy-D-xylulose-5-phosphate reductoisomerase
MRVLLIGATGSIGASTLNCIRRYRDRFTVTGLAAHSSHTPLAALASEFDVKHVSLCDHAAAGEARGLLSSQVRLYEGAQGLVEMVEQTEFDVLVNALVGSAGLPPTVAALKRGKRIALANKESLVVGGEVVTALAHRHGAEIIPVDSEHSAILQCLHGERRDTVESIILTASGGPFRDAPPESFEAITPEQALRHPTWAMGSKITIDSATLVNKGFEIIEAHFLFDMPYDKLRVCIHPQSIIHSMVEYHDGAVLAQLGVPDMELPIQYALEYPHRMPLPGRRLDLADIGTLTFQHADTARFPCLRLCTEAGSAGGAAPVVLNAANEVAVRLFLDGHIRFTSIAGIISEALSAASYAAPQSLEEILDIDTRTRGHAETWVRRNQV